MTALSQFMQGAIRPKGTYAPATQYFPGNIVSYNGSVYICKQTCTNTPPPNSTYWDLIAQAPNISVATTGAGTDPKKFTLTSNGSTITLNKVP